MTPATTVKTQYSDYQKFDARAYAAEHYGVIYPDEQTGLEFLVECLQQIPSIPVALDFGCGPTVSHLLPFTAKAKEIHAADYLAVNRAEIEKWAAQKPDAWDWRKSTLEILRLEGNPQPRIADAQKRERETRDRITAILPCDATQSDPLGADKREFYSLVTAHFCVDVTANNLGSFFRVGDNYFPHATVSPQDVVKCFCDNGFVNIDLKVRQIEHPPGEQAYDCVIVACGFKPEL